MTDQDNTAGHRRLASQDACEGLREALKSLTPNQRLVLLGHDQEIDSRRARTRARNDLRAMKLMWSEGDGLTPEGEALAALLTPPSDAGSTTRSGGEESRITGSISGSITQFEAEERR